MRPGSADAAFVSSLVDGKAVRDVDVSWLDADGKVLGQARTDGDGRAAFAERPHNARIVHRPQGEQLSLIALKEPHSISLNSIQPGWSLLPFASSPTAAVISIALAKARFAVARVSDGHPVPAQPIQALLRRPDGKAQWTANWSPSHSLATTSSRSGHLPTDAATCAWRLELRADPAARHASSSLDFNVEEFLPERMKLDPGPSSGTRAAGADWQLAVQELTCTAPPPPATACSVSSIPPPIRRHSPTNFLVSFSATLTKPPCASAKNWKKSPLTRKARHNWRSTCPPWTTAAHHSPSAPHSSLLESGGRPGHPQRRAHLVAGPDTGRPTPTVQGRICTGKLQR